MRIMVVTDQYEPMVGGVPRVTSELARGLAERGHAVALVVPSLGWRGRRAVTEQVSVTYRGSLRWPWYEGMRLGCLPAGSARKLIASFCPVHEPLPAGQRPRFRGAALTARRRPFLPARRRVLEPVRLCHRPHGDGAWAAA
jgi:hypothetical protein